MVQDPFLVAFFYGIVPAMGLLAILHSEYRGLLDEKRVFKTFFVGVVAGMLGTVLATALAGQGARWSAGSGPGPMLGILGLYAVLLGLLESLIFTSVLNWRAYRGRRDTPFYGAAFGYGYGATNVLFLMGYILAARGQTDLTTALLDLVQLSLLGIYFAGTILAHGWMGAWIGRGTATGPLAPHVVKAGLVSCAYFILVYALVGSASSVGPGAFLMLAGAALGVALFIHMIRGVLDAVVPPEILREIGIHNRRLARRIQTEPKPPA